MRFLLFLIIMLSPSLALSAPFSGSMTCPGGATEYHIGSTDNVSVMPGPGPIEVTGPIVGGADNGKYKFLFTADATGQLTTGSTVPTGYETYDFLYVGREFSGGMWYFQYHVSCPVPQEPVTCANGVQDPDEGGVDCGSGCASPDDVCTEFCPEGWTNLAGTCYSPETNMIGGVCPDGTTIENITDQTCVRSQPTLRANYDYDSPVNGVSPEWTFTDENSSWVSDVVYNTVDNGDGTTTETTTQTETASNPDGTSSTTTTTTTTVINKASGLPVSSSTTTDTTGQSVSGDVVANVSSGDYDPTIEGIPEKEDIGLLLGLIEASPIITSLDTFEVQTSGASCEVDMGLLYGVQLSPNLCRWEPDLQTLGALLLMIVQAYALLVVYRGWK